MDTRQVFPRTLSALTQASGDYVSTQDVADFLGVTPRTVSRWLRDGRLSGIKLSNRGGWRISVSELAAWIDHVGAVADDEEPMWLP